MLCDCCIERVRSQSWLDMVIDECQIGTKLSIFIYGGIAISWISNKQSITATSSNHAELIALFEVVESVWLRSVIQHIQQECCLDCLESIKKKINNIV